MNYGSEFRNKSSSLNHGEDEEVADGLSDNSSRLQKMDFHNYVNKEITFVRSNDIRKYARGKHTQLTLVERCARNMGWVARPMSEW